MVPQLEQVLLLLQEELHWFHLQVDRHLFRWLSSALYSLIWAAR